MNSHFLLSLISVDPSLGRIDKHSLSQQTLMELFIEGFTNIEHLFGSKENPSDISEWYLLKFNDTKDIVEITWSFQPLEGSIDLRWLPLSIRRVYLNSNQLSGSVDLTCLHDGLQVLYLECNFFEGRVDLTKLPVSLLSLSLGHNGFMGTTDFNELPKSLAFLNVANTYLEGEICHFDGELLTYDSNVLDRRQK